MDEVKLLKPYVNIVRQSHYPQSPSFLGKLKCENFSRPDLNSLTLYTDACDSIGMLVWVEAPGWGYIGDDEYKRHIVQNVAQMVQRDRNHPSVVVWGARLNECPGKIGFDV
jgi:beta-galactosidase